MTFNFLIETGALVCVCMCDKREDIRKLCCDLTHFNSDILAFQAIDLSEQTHTHIVFQHHVMLYGYCNQMAPCLITIKLFTELLFIWYGVFGKYSYTGEMCYAVRKK